jgi:hypothetical protein
MVVEVGLAPRRRSARLPDLRRVLHPLGVPGCSGHCQWPSGGRGRRNMRVDHNHYYRLNRLQLNDCSTAGVEPQGLW